MIINAKNNINIITNYVFEAPHISNASSNSPIKKNLTIINNDKNRYLPKVINKNAINLNLNKLNTNSQHESLPKFLVDNSLKNLSTHNKTKTMDKLNFVEKIKIPLQNKIKPQIKEISIISNINRLNKPQELNSSNSQQSFQFKTFQPQEKHERINSETKEIKKQLPSSRLKRMQINEIIQNKKPKIIEKIKKLINSS